MFSEKISVIAFGVCFLILGAGLGLSACSKKTDKEAIEAVIEEEVQARIRQFQKFRMQRCQMDVLEEAGRIADSILLLEARLSRDTIAKPPIPAKPEKPEVKTVLDSTPIRPFRHRDSITVRDSVGE